MGREPALSRSNWSIFVEPIGCIGPPRKIRWLFECVTDGSEGGNMWRRGNGGRGGVPPRSQGMGRQGGAHRERAVSTIRIGT